MGKIKCITFDKKAQDELPESVKLKMKYNQEEEVKRKFFYDTYYSEPSEEFLEKQKSAFDAAIAYEENCITKYDHPFLPSRTPKKGETMSDFAFKFGTTIEEMKNQWKQVDEAFKKKDLNNKKGKQ